MMNIDSVFLDMLLAIGLNVLTQIAKRFHTDAMTVFKVVAFHVCLVYGAVSYLGYKEQLAAIGASIISIVAMASGFWHLLMRPEGPLMKWWNSRK